MANKKTKDSTSKKYSIITSIFASDGTLLEEHEFEFTMLSLAALAYDKVYESLSLDLE